MQLSSYGISPTLAGNLQGDFCFTQQDKKTTNNRFCPHRIEMTGGFGSRHKTIQPRDQNSGRDNRGDDSLTWQQRALFEGSILSNQKCYGPDLKRPSFYKPQRVEHDLYSKARLPLRGDKRDEARPEWEDQKLPALKKNHGSEEVLTWQQEQMLQAKQGFRGRRNAPLDLDRDRRTLSSLEPPPSRTEKPGTGRSRGRPRHFPPVSSSALPELRHLKPFFHSEETVPISKPIEVPKRGNRKGDSFSTRNRRTNSGKPIRSSLDFTRGERQDQAPSQTSVGDLEDAVTSDLPWWYNPEVDGWLCAKLGSEEAPLSSPKLGHKRGSSSGSNTSLEEEPSGTVSRTLRKKASSLFGQSFDSMPSLCFSTVSSSDSDNDESVEDHEVTDEGQRARDMKNQSSEVHDQVRIDINELFAAAEGAVTATAHDVYAGPVFCNAPLPTSLPVPSFGKRP
ncbi:hypothetical protein IE53DRAFT_108173 [Violaceomyces palustris]|uniref:Uncharacterized protein n=1 Tax=Violaceomyces palustris TaxID=1673888 RepID=A0ACD0P6U2_9BASI|nr:hypothetical protein IE53DRAFT_108173 [Violaceomyces palustris]